MAREHQTDRATPSLAAEVERPATNTDPGGHMSEHRITPGEPGTLFDAVPVVDHTPVTDDTEGLMRHDAADTSRAAVRPGLTGRQRPRVLRYLVQHGPATDPEIADALGLNPNSERPRRVELVSGGYVADSGDRRAHNGSAHIVWVATEAGRAAARELECAA